MPRGSLCIRPCCSVGVVVPSRVVVGTCPGACIPIAGRRSWCASIPVSQKERSMRQRAISLPVGVWRDACADHIAPPLAPASRWKKRCLSRLDSTRVCRFCNPAAIPTRWPGAIKLGLWSTRSEASSCSPRSSPSTSISHTFAFAYRCERGVSLAGGNGTRSLVCPCHGDVLAHHLSLRRPSLLELLE